MTAAFKEKIVIVFLWCGNQLPGFIDLKKRYTNRIPWFVINVIIGYMQGRCKQAFFTNLSSGLLDVKRR